MPLWHCCECDHEWEGNRDWCDWCGADGTIIEKRTALETLLGDRLRRRLGWPDGKPAKRKSN